MSGCSHLDQIRGHGASPPIPPAARSAWRSAAVGAPTHVHDLRENRVLRLFAEPPREPARSEASPDHPSAERGEDWSWCYVDEVAFIVR